MPLTDVYTGANGTLLFSHKESPEGADAEAIMKPGAYNLDAEPVGRVTGVEIHVETDLEEFHEIGLRHASSLHPGNIHIRGKVDRAYINGALLYLLLGRGAARTKTKEPYVQPALLMAVRLIDPANPEVFSVITLYGVQFENWSFALPEDDFVMENATFKALGINVGDSVEDNVITPFQEEAAS